MITKKCELCKKIINTYPCLKDRKKFCSIKCRRIGIVTLEYRKKIRERLEIDENKRKYPWQSKKFVRWSGEVKKLGDYICKNCGCDHKSKLVAHHIKSFREFPALRYEVKNGIVLCRGCHAKIHHTTSDYKEMQRLSVIKKKSIHA